MSKRKVPPKEVLYELYVNQRKSAGEIAKMYDIACRSNVLRQLKKMGIIIRQPIGENHPHWKGGKITKGDGYIGIWKPNHERADKQGYVYEHTLMAEQKYGRLPIKGEVIHHININKKDNSPNNLFLCNHTQHTKLHRSLDKMIKQLLEKNILTFDENEGIYKLTKEGLF